MKGILIAAMLCFTFAKNAQAGTFYMGNDLVETMPEYEKAERGAPRTDFVKAGYFRGYVLGVNDVFSGYVFCTPDSATISQVSAIVAKYVNTHPERWTVGASVLVTDALKEAFPCPKKK